MAKMRAYTAENGVLLAGLHPRPTLGKRDVLIRTHAVGVNRADIFQRQGRYPSPDGNPILGLEVSGEIIEIGEAVPSLWQGKRVATLLTSGGYAEYVAAPVETLFPLPETITDQEAAALPEALYTSWLSLVDKGGLASKERFFMPGGTSGIGIIALQMAKYLGAECFASARSEAKCSIIRDLGITAINAQTENTIARLKERTDGEGVDCILDLLGGKHTEEHLSALRPNGRLVLISVLEGKEATLSLARILMKNLTLVGCTVRSQSKDKKHLLHQGIMERIWPQIEARKIKPRVDRIFSFSEASEAHSYMESGAHAGKIILQC